MVLRVRLEEGPLGGARLAHGAARQWSIFLFIPDTLWTSGCSEYRVFRALGISHEERTSWYSGCDSKKACSAARASRMERRATMSAWLRQTRPM